MPETYRTRESEALRVLFCFGVAQNFFDADTDVRAAVVQELEAAFDDLHGRFGITVMGTLDDDDLVVGPSCGWPWTAYILAEAPDLDAVRVVTTLVREREVGGARLWRYVKVEARVGRKLFFGNA